MPHKDLLNDRYNILKEIDSGMSATVYLAEIRHSHTQVVIKFFKQDFIECSDESV
jgi:hypothetical protein